MKVRLQIVLTVVLTVCISACAGGPKAPKEAKLATEVVAAADLNPNRRDTPQPVKLHVYYLKQDEAFVQATFSELVGADAASIAADLVRRIETLVGPGETQTLDSTFDEQVRFIGVVAEFTRIDSAKWRSVVMVPEDSWTNLLNPFKDEKLVISVGAASVDSAIVED